MTTFDFLSLLNPQQQAAVTTPPGPTLVMAGPGSGKTRVLTYRIAYLIGALGVQPFHILAVTFTNKAAREMEARLENLLGTRMYGLTVGTFHAFCARLLRREADHLPFQSNFVIFDADDQVNLVKRALADLNLDPKQYRPQAVHAAISNAKNDLLLPPDFLVRTYRDQVVQRVYERYQELLLASNALDFDDLLLWAVRLLSENEAVRQRYARRFKHILVDEFQDTNPAQYQLLKLLASHHHRNLFVVGDIDQSIYSWRGADYRNVLRFEEDFPNARVILLEENYRSTQTILDAAMAVIAPLQYKHRKQLFTQRGRGAKITMHRTYNDREEAAFVVHTIAHLVASGQARPEEIAVMYRTNAQSRLLEEAFLTAGMPYRLVGAQRFYGRREIKDLVAYLRLAHNPSDEASLLRVINTPPRGIGPKTVQTLRQLAANRRRSPGAVLLDLAAEPEAYREAFKPRVFNVLLPFALRLAQWHTVAPELAPLQLLDRILGDTGYQTYLNDSTEEGLSRWENVQELRRLAGEYQERGLEAFLEDLALISDQDTLREGEAAPTLLTLHAAKGLEFRVVFIVGLVEGLLPHFRSLEDAEAMAEERRLFYVGITRAKDRLYLTYPEQRTAYGYSEPADPSRFLEDIPPDLVEGDHPLKDEFGTSWERATTWGNASAPSGSVPILEPQFRTGMQVEHPKWGCGMVIGSRVDDGDEIVDVFFDSVGLKRVIASLAHLTIVDREKTE
ncbi:MAG TPA: UvrD-helicase domain-containing protein [Anaerolineae bacterium]|nr:UvrD-helicase domain-containing protein [Anaerolineae bacterium]